MVLIEAFHWILRKIMVLTRNVGCPPCYIHVYLPLLTVGVAMKAICCLQCSSNNQDLSATVNHACMCVAAWCLQSACGALHTFTVDLPVKTTMKSRI